MLFEIKHLFTGNVIFSLETKSMKLCVEMAVSSRANLSGADLSGADLYGANLSRANLSRADLSRADLYGANLSRANLSRADLYGANLSRANLSRADLSRADLSGANLYGANLSGAKIKNRRRVSPLDILFDQPEKIRAYKLVDAEYQSPMQSSPKLTYSIGSVVEVKKADTSDVDCSAGVNVATLDWCLRERKEGWRVMLVEFEAKDIASIPLGTNGKFRLYRCTVIKELTKKELGE
jgi:uncharacterized protein YjbI with pentapeptide repeats